MSPSSCLPEVDERSPPQTIYQTPLLLRYLPGTRHLGYDEMNGPCGPVFDNPFIRGSGAHPADVLQHHLDRGVDANRPRVDRQIVVGGVSPDPPGVSPAILGPGPVLRRYALVSVLLGDPVAGRGPLYPIGDRSGDEHADYIVPIAEDVVRAPSDEYEGPFEARSLMTAACSSNMWLAGGTPPK